MKTKMGKTKKPVKYCVVDAFTDTEFKGNPAAVCLLEEERDEEWLQLLATEFNLSETCYLIRLADSDSDSDSDSRHPRFHLRWFTPTAEVELCGHATLAAAHVCFSSNLVTGNTIEFSTLSGILTAKKVLKSEESVSVNSENGDTEKFLIELDFPAISSVNCSVNEISSLSKLSDASITECKKTAIEDYLVVLPSADAVIAYQPNLDKIRKVPGRGLIITALSPPDSGFDFLSRFFAPKYGIDEDPVCGSAHCALAVYWSKKLGKSDLIADAASPRSGILRLHMDEQTMRVKLQGQAVIVMQGSVIV